MRLAEVTQAKFAGVYRAVFTDLPKSQSSDCVCSDIALNNILNVLAHLYHCSDFIFALFVHLSARTDSDDQMLRPKDWNEVYSIF